MSDDGLVGEHHSHYKRHPEQPNSIRLRSADRIIHGQGIINPEYYSAREHARKCGALGVNKGVD